MADHLANSWESSVGSQVEGDSIVALSWLHNGVKLALHVEKVRGLTCGGVVSDQPVSPLPLPEFSVMCQACLRGIPVSNCHP